MVNIDEDPGYDADRDSPRYKYMDRAAHDPNVSHQAFRLYNVLDSEAGVSGSVLLDGPILALMAQVARSTSAAARSLKDLTKAGYVRIEPAQPYDRCVLTWRDASQPWLVK